MGWMHGLPQAVKDLADVAGFRTSQGSPLTPPTPAGNDGLMAARMRAAGCIMIGKTNTPEFGLGSHTFNEVLVLPEMLGTRPKRRAVAVAVPL